MDNIKRITPYFSEKARGAGYVSMIEYDLYEIERIFRECDEALAEAGMPGLDYISQAGEIDEMLDNLSTLLAYAENAHSYVSDNLDFPLYTDFKNHATESLSHIVMDDIYTENTIGMEEHTEVNVEGTLYVGKQVKPHLRFSDFLGIVEIEPKDGYPVLENIETVGEFASLFRADYDKMKPTVEINKFLEGYLVTGEFEHVGYHPVRDFLSGLADLTIVIPILDCILGKDIITGEDFYFLESHLIATLYQKEELHRELTTLGAKIIGRSGNALNCVALWAEDKGTGVLVHQEKKTLLCAYLPILTKEKAQYEMDMAKRIKRLASTKKIKDLERGFFPPNGSYRIDKLLSDLAEHLEH